MSKRNLGAGLLAAMTFGMIIVTPFAANAQRGWDKDWQDRRDDNRNRNDRNDRKDRNDRWDNDRDGNKRRGNSRDWDDRRNNDWRRDDRDWRDNNRSRNNRNDWRDKEWDRRQDTKNEWRNIAIGAGAIGVLGLLNRDNRLVFAGGAGALYSLYRYEEDRQSQNQLDRARAEYFSRPYFYRDGVRYERQTVVRNGERCYQFTRR